MSTPTAPRVREGWIDVAKGIAIMLVVFFHAVMYSLQLDLAQGWVRFTYTLDTFRMPMFFFMSGLLAQRAVQQQPFPYLFRKRMLLLLYLYVLWCCLQRLFSWALPPSSLHPSPSSWTDLLTIFVFPHPNLWFIYALPIFFAVAWATRRLPPPLVLAGAAVLAAAFGPGLLDIGSSPWGKTGRYLFFFLAAVYTSRVVRERAPRLRPIHLGATFATYLVVVLVLTFTAVRSLPFAVLVGGMVAVVFGIALAVNLSGTALTAPLEYLGRRTLPIYLVHTFPMIAVAAVLLPALGRLPSWFGTILPPALTLLAVTCGLLADRYVRVIPGLLDVPVKDWVRPRERIPVAVNPRA
jgi:uncharacterized membrane protein YcfT